MLFVLENNRYAQTTPISINLAGSIRDRFEAFGIATDEVDTVDVLDVYNMVKASAECVRSGDGPHAVVIHTYRFAPHSKGDDMRDPEEVKRYRERDPILLHAERLKLKLRRKIEAEVTAEVDEAFHQAKEDPLADPVSLTFPLDDI